MLLGEREARVQGQHFVVQARRLGDHCLDGVLGVADFAFAGEEDEDVAGGFLGELLDGVEDAVGGVVVVFDFVVAEVVFLVERAVADFHGVGSAGHLNDGRRVVGQDRFGDFAFFGAEVFVDDALARHVAGGEVACETLRVDGRGGDDDLQIRALRQDALEVAEDEVNVQATFVRFVNDEGGVAAQQLVVLDLGEQNAVGHELDSAVFAHFGGEPHLVADGFTDFLSEFFGDAFGDGACGEAARLGVADEALLAQTQVEAHFGDLGGFTGAGFTRDDDDLVVADRLHDVFAAFADGQLFGVGDDLGNEGFVAARCRAVLLAALVVALLVAQLAGAVVGASASVGAGGVGVAFGGAAGGVLVVCVILLGAVLLCTLLRGAVFYRVVLSSFICGFASGFFAGFFGGSYLCRVDCGGHARHGGGGAGGLRSICVFLRGFLLRHILSSVLALPAVGLGCALFVIFGFVRGNPGWGAVE